VWKGRLEHPYTAHLRDRQQATNSPSAQETGEFFNIIINSGLRIRIRINLSCWIRIRIQEGKNDPQKKKKLKGFMF
jgi:hypothetical protein